MGSYVPQVKIVGNIPGITGSVAIEGASGSNSIKITSNAPGITQTLRVDGGSIDVLGNVRGITLPVRVYGNVTTTTGNGVIILGSNLAGITLPLSVSGGFDVSGNVAGITAPLTIASFSAPVRVYGDLGAISGNIPGITAPLQVASIAAPVRVFGNIDAIAGNVAGVTQAVTVYGDVGVTGNLAGITAPLTISNVSSAVRVSGDVAISGNVFGITNPVYVYGNVVANSSAGGNVEIIGNVFGIDAPVAATGNLQSVTGNFAGVTAQVAVASVTASVALTGTVGNVTGNVYGITSNVFIVGNVTGSNGAAVVVVSGNLAGITSAANTWGSVAFSGNIGGVTAPVQLRGTFSEMTGNLAGITAPLSVSNVNSNVAVAGEGMRIIGNVAGITNPVTVVGNLDAIVGNIAGVTQPITINGTLTPLGGGNLTPTTILGNVPGITASRDVTTKGHADGAGRARTAGTVALVRVKQVANIPDVSAVSVVAGTGNVWNVPQRNCNFLIVGPGAGSAIRRSRLRGITFPGASFLVQQAFRMSNGAGKANLVQQVGFYEGNNGGMFRMTANVPSFVIRSNVSGPILETVSNQSSWNVDKLDGTGRSGVALDFTKQQILHADFGTLAGRVRFGFHVDGRPVIAHTANTIGTPGGVAFANPNMFLCWESNSGGGIVGTANVEQTSGVVFSEQDATDVSSGVLYSQNVEPALVIPASNTTYEIGAFRNSLNGTYLSTFRPYSMTVNVQAAASGTNWPIFSWSLNVNATMSNPRSWLGFAGSPMEWTSAAYGGVSVANSGRVVAAGMSQSLRPFTIKFPKSLDKLIGVHANGDSETLSILMTNHGSIGLQPYVNFRLWSAI